MLGFLFNSSMKVFKLSILVCVALATNIAHSQVKTLDFSGGDHSFSVFESSDIRLDPFKDIPYLRTISGGTYRILLPGNIEYLLKIERGEIRNHLDKEGYVNRMKLITPALSLEASKKLAYEFHRKFGLETDDLDKWFNELENGEAYSMYGKGGVSGHYPRLSMALRTTFGKEKPAFALFSISWDKKFSDHWGTSLENNEQLDVTYDMPELLEGVPEFTEVPDVEPVIVKVDDTQPFVAETPKPEPTTEKPAEVKTPETSQEPPEEPSQWWLWLIGAVVVVGALGLIVRRKN